MKIQNLFPAVPTAVALAMLLLVGCRPAAPFQPAEVYSDSAGSDEAQRATDKALGKQAQIIARGDLARSGHEQVLAVNRFATSPGKNVSAVNSEPIFVSRAVILEKSDSQWTEIFRCDEHLKNQNGYLGGSTVTRVTGWRLEFSSDSNKGLELKFTPADDPAGREGTGMGGPGGKTVMVRWNPRVRRYQSLDASQDEYLSEIPTIETPQSILR